MSKRLRYILAGACALLAVLCALSYGSAQKREIEQERSDALKKYGGEVTAVVVSSKPLTSGEVLSSKNCEISDWIVDLLPNESFATLDEVAGKQVFGALDKGVPITKAMLENPAQSYEIPSGSVALSVVLSDKTGVDSQVSAGTHLCAYRAYGDETRLLSCNVEVLEAASTSAKTQSITVAVPEAEIVGVIAANSDGTLRLVRPAADVVENVQNMPSVNNVAVPAIDQTEE